MHAPRPLILVLAFCLMAVAALAWSAPGQAAPTTPIDAWTKQSPAISPSARDRASMAYDEKTEQVVLFGGAGHDGTLGDTWTWDGTTWTKRSPEPSPPALDGASMAYDGKSEQVVLFGGAGQGGLLGDTWTWGGTAWTKRSPVASPPARAGASMAYDAATDQVVLFGGAGQGGLLGDTWTWDGTTWTKRSPEPSPPARESASMAYDVVAYDVATGQIVLFGGAGDPGRSGERERLGDTWTWDGTTWTKQSPAASPAARFEAPMTYDAAAHRIVLFGGFDGIDDEDGIFGDTWTWGGTTWTQQAPETGPSAREAASMAYDAAARRVVLFGGFGAGGVLGDTWTYRLTFGSPSASIASPAGGQTYTIGQAVPTEFSCRDAVGGPGIESCVGSGGATSGHGSLDTSAVGPHTYTVIATSESGEVGEASIDYEVTLPAPQPAAPVDAHTTARPAHTPAPSVHISHSPNGPHAPNPKIGLRYTFRFTDAAPGTTFRCRLDKGPFRICHSPKVYRHLKRGRHVFRVKSVDAAGVESPTRKVKFVAGGHRRR